MVDPARRVAAKQRVNDTVFVHMEVKRVVRVFGVVGVAVLRLVPADDLAHVFDQGFAFSDVLQREDAFAMHT